VQSYTHLAIGATVGAMVFPHLPEVQLACLVGAVAPDVPTALLYGLDRLSGRRPLSHQPKGWILVKNICQNIFLWVAVALTGLTLGLLHWPPSIVATMLVALGVNGAIHVIVDSFTHGNPELQKEDGWFAWPVSRWQRVGWDYRINVGQLWPPKTFEKYVLVFCLFSTIFLWVL
jgi:hypothetical protein